MTSLVAVLTLGLFVQAPSAVPAEPSAMSTPTEAAPMAAAKDGPWKPYEYGSSEQRRHSVSSGTLVVIAYGLIWLVLLLYVGVLASRQRRLRVEMGGIPTSSMAGSSVDVKKEAAREEGDA